MGKGNKSWTHHIFILIPVLFWHPRVGVAVPHRELHGAAEGTSDWKREKSGITGADSSAGALSSQKETAISISFAPGIQNVARAKHFNIIFLFDLKIKTKGGAQESSRGNKPLIPNAAMRSSSSHQEEFHKDF